MKHLMLIVIMVLLTGAAHADALPGPWAATASVSAAEAALAVDGDARTAWHTEVPQDVGQRLQIDLGAMRLVREVRIHTARREPTSFPRGLAVKLSADGSRFEQVAAVENLNRMELRLRFNPTPCRHVRLELTGSSGYPWSVSEVAVFGAMSPAALNTKDAVIIAPDAPPVVRFAAEDLRDYLSRATGSYLRLVDDQAAGDYPGMKYAVGRNLLTEGHLEDLEGLVTEAILLRKSGDTVILAGNAPRADAYAVCRLLHRLGVRWYTPGDLGEHVPALEQVNLEGLDVVHEPSIELREVSTVRMESLEDDVVWTIRNCLSYPGTAPVFFFKERTGIWWKPALLDWPYGHYPHSFQRIIPGALLEKHPDIQPMLGGARRTYQGPGENFCTSSPEAVELVTQRVLEWFRANPQSRSFSICPQDGSEWCECERCQKLDEPLVMENFSRKDMRNVTDRFFTFLNQVASRVSEAFPDRLITTIGYANWHQPPRIDVHPNILVNVCQYGCSSHAVNDPACDRNIEMRTRMEGWRKRVKRLGVYDYVLLNSAAPMTPHPYGRSVSQELQWLDRELDVTTWWSETAGFYCEWSPEAYWLALQTAWDSDQDPEALLDEFRRNYYGPAQGARDYWQILDRRVQEDGVHYASYNNRPTAEMFDEQTLAQLEVAITKAESEAPAGSVYAGRVGKLRESLDFVKQFLAEPGK